MRVCARRRLPRRRGRWCSPQVASVVDQGRGAGCCRAPAAGGGEGADAADLGGAVRWVVVADSQWGDVRVKGSDDRLVTGGFVGRIDVTVPSLARSSATTDSSSCPADPTAVPCLAKARRGRARAAGNAGKSPVSNVEFHAIGQGSLSNRVV